MFGKKIAIFFILCFVGIVFCQSPVTQFTAKTIISPNNTPGKITAVIYYDQVAKQIRFDYPQLKDPTGVNTGLISEYYNYATGVEYQLCKSCTVYKLTATFPKYYYEATDVPDTTHAPITNDQSATCTAFRKVNPPLSGNVATIWLTSTYTPCQVQRVDGTILTFSAVAPGAQSASLFIVPPNANCPNNGLPVCQAPIDLVLVLDQSGSIHLENGEDQWGLLLSFANVIINSFTIGPTQTQVGLVFFSGVDWFPPEDPSVCCGLSDPVLPLSYDEPTIKKFLNNHQQTGGHTCINCGIKSATTYEPNPNRAIAVPRVMLVLTDGFNNRMTNFFAQDVAYAKSQGWDMFAVGVGTVNISELNQIASEPLSTHFIYVESFSDLKGITSFLTDNICKDFPTNTSCGVCAGICTCGGDCFCPDICTPPTVNGQVNKCQVAQTVSTPTSCIGCFVTNTTCDPNATNGNKCKINTCDPATGNCVLQNIVCTPTDACFTASCDPNVGCVYTDSCAAIINTPGTNTPSLCLNRTCDSTTKTCTSTPVTCTPPNACSTAACDPNLGCVNTPVNCDDSDRCTTDTCDNVKGCVHTPVNCATQFQSTPAYKANPAAFNCLSFVCDPKVGCSSTTKTCDDGNACTTDSCNQSTGLCVNTPITCQQDGDKCSQITCDIKLGCLKQPIVVCNDGKSCTTDACNPATGTCVYTPVVCPPAPNSCSTSVCDETAKQCINKPTIACTGQPQNLCQALTCNPTTNTCTATVAQTCVPQDLCSTVTCSPTAGCVQSPKNCNDNNPCTTDTCDVPTGNCVHTPLPGCTTCNCTSTDPCNPQKCGPTPGTCVTVPVVCPINKCATITPKNINGNCVCVPTNPLVCPPVPAGQCGDNVCNPATGQCSVQGGRVCNDNNPCTTDTCALVNGTLTCTFTAIPCAGDSPCSRQKCINQNGVGTCVPDTSSGINCATASACVSGVCNTATGQCVYTTNPCPNLNSTTCSRNVCDPVTRKCVPTTGLNCAATDPVGCGIDGVCVLLNGQQTCSYQPSCPISENICTINTCTPSTTNQGGTCTSTQVNCNDNNPCTVNDRCSPDGVDQFGNPKTKCIYDNFNCPALTNPCQLNKCVNQNGNPVCVPTSVTCPPPNNCSTGQCIVNTQGVGVCQYTPINCGKSDICGTFICDPVNGCTKVYKCNDNNPCTNDICDPTTGACSFTPKVCNSSSICKNATCDPNAGCVEIPIDCSTQPNITTFIDACHFPVCAPNNGCQLAIIPNTLDACGFCNQPGKCNPRSTGVSPGAVAGAVIGGSVAAGCAAVGIGAFAAAKSGTAFAPAGDAPIVGANTNPLYAQPNTAGTNPFHGDAVGGDYVPLTN